MVMRAVVRTAVALALAVLAWPVVASSVRVKDLGRFEGRRENQLVGFGVVIGLAGTGDSPRNQATRQALANLMARFELDIPSEQVLSRNVAMVMLTAALPPNAHVGDKLDVTVASTGDARSLAGGTLVMAELRGPDRRVYALAQGPINVGGFFFEANGNQRQKNHPTVGTLSGGATVEAPLRADYQMEQGRLRFVIRQPDATTAQRIAERINERHGEATAVALGPEEVSIRVPGDPTRLNAWVATIEGLAVVPDAVARVVVNSRTGTIAAGGDLRVAPVTVSHGDLQVAVTTEYSATSPTTVGLIAINGSAPVVLANSTLRVAEGGVEVAESFPGTTVAELVRTLSQARVGTRDIIAILQAVQAAGALHAQIVTQ